jgi:hypothetical protein
MDLIGMDWDGFNRDEVGRIGLASFVSLCFASFRFISLHFASFYFIPHGFASSLVSLYFS